jgi:phytoene dehydrogenase-like protein
MNGRRRNSLAFYTFGLTLFPLGHPLAEPPPAQARATPVPWVETQNVPLDVLVHAFFFDSAESKNSLALQSIVSEDGLVRLQPELEAMRLEMLDTKRMAPRTRKMCADLQNAKTGIEFAAILAAADGAQRDRMREHARRALAVLDVNDRSALERYLDTQFRASFRHYAIDYDAMFGTESVPSSKTIAMTAQICEAASKLEGGVTP